MFMAFFFSRVEGMQDRRRPDAPEGGREKELEVHGLEKAPGKHRRRGSFCHPGWGAIAQPGASGRCLPQEKTSGHFFRIERVGVAPPGLQAKRPSPLFVQSKALAHIREAEWWRTHETWSRPPSLRRPRLALLRKHPAPPRTEQPTSEVPRRSVRAKLMSAVRMHRRRRRRRRKGVGGGGG